ncbi:DGQHR domain-containing protein [Candidatus Enterococcus ikei]|uniref:DGQHR domain-containing protein n=1 Tax=Candidatus Enterococcus ikei TaxID=2815326 RepID=A0ABS3H2N7_9ENTE|nr:DGQHR domain-containing protein [Enterococcus sp. DIV0869a]MBO0441792.1 DGQHR domain-containing protein [Enterococcus sp. DIV0869a]
MNENYDVIIDGKELASKKKLVTKEYDYLSVKHNDLDEYLKSGWEVEKEYKSVVRIKKNKSEKELFVNTCWNLFSNLGFEKMNSNQVEIGSSQVDIVAIDDETVIFAFCRFSDQIQVRDDLLTDIESIVNNRENCIKYARNFPDGKKRKHSIILITKNYLLTDRSASLMDGKIIHFNEENVKYYEDLANHLGSVSRFQLLGYLFSGQKIPEMDNRIPAIEGEMGGYKYYSFSIEPEKLLKVGYVLHRNNANKGMMPTYQRIIKKNRLTSIQSFVENGGFFPNSLIINIEAKKINFDYSERQVENALSRIGVLHLPKVYRSAYIIDGQHRLYGYANSKYAQTNSIPVVAFINLEKYQQVKLFMEINENQKAVPKNLRTTLNADILGASKYFFERQIALKSQIAQNLAEDLDSPLLQRIIVGENPTTERCNITLDTIQQALDQSDFFDMYSKKSNDLLVQGTLDTGTNEETEVIVMKFLKENFYYIEQKLQGEWNETEKSRNFLVTNPGIYSLIKVMNDIVNFITEQDNIDIKKISIEELLEKMKIYLDVIISFYKNVSFDERTKIKKTYGGNGKKLYWRTLQKELHREFPEFSPAEMISFWKDNDKRFNEITYSYIREIELYMREDFKEKLQEKYGDDWFNKLPKTVYDQANKLASDKNYGQPQEKAVDPWTCLNFIHFRDIALNNWQDLFSNKYTLPEEKGRSGKKEDKTKWMVKLSGIRNENSHVYVSVKEEEYKFAEKIHNWLIK